MRNQSSHKQKTSIFPKNLKKSDHKEQSDFSLYLIKTIQRIYRI